MKHSFFWLVLMLLSCFCSEKKAMVYPAYYEKDGLVSIEAENFTSSVGPWEEVEGRNTVTEYDAGLGNDPGQEKLIINQNQDITTLNDNEIEVADAPVTLNWGFPNENGIVIASLSTNTRKAAVFAYPEGAKMPDLVAPQVRVGLYNGYDNLTEHGNDLFNQVITWAANKSEGNTVLMITGSAPPTGFDVSAREKLLALGFKVEVIDDEDCETENANGKRLIYISESVSSGPVGNKFREVIVPVVVCEPYVFDDMGMVIQKEFWQPESGQLGNAILNRENNPNYHLTYSILFQQPGNYQLSVLGQNNGTAQPATIPVNLHQKTTFNPTEASHFDLGQNFRWHQGAKLKVEEPGWYNLQIGIENQNQTQTAPYPGWRIDKILLSNSDLNVSEDGPLQTKYDEAVEVPAYLQGPPPFLPSQVYQENEGYAIAEAESISHHDYWVLKKEPAGYTGEGYLEWQGPNRTVSIEGLGGNHDSLFVRQGPQQEWLIFRVNIKNPGKYLVNARNIHQKEDGDNDAWVNLVGFKPDQEKKQVISRMGDSHDDGKGFTWLDWGVRSFQLDSGINNIFIGGRSIGFGIDRLAVYRENDEKAKNNALDVSNSPSELIK